MPSKILHFRGTADWVQTAVEDEILHKTKAVVTVKHADDSTIGTLKLDAKTQKDLDEALSLIANHSVFKFHFKSSQ